MKRILGWILILLAILCFVEAILVHTGFANNGVIFSNFVSNDLLVEGSRFMEFSAAWQSWVIVGVSLLLIAFLIAPDIAGEIITSIGKTVVEIVKRGAEAVVEVAGAAASSLGPLILVGAAGVLGFLILKDSFKGDK